MSKRGIRRAFTPVRLAVAAAVLVGGGAAGVVALSTSNGGALAADSAGYSHHYNGRTMGYTSALSSAMNSWDKAPSQSLMTLSQMEPVTNYWTQSWHRSVLFIQRGVVIAVGHNEFVVESANGTIEIWHVSGGTITDNVGSSATGMSAMTGGTMRVPDSWKMNTRVRGIAKGDLVFIFGQRENHTLKAQLVLFAAPTAVRTVTPTSTPTWMPTSTPTSTVTVTATPTAPAAVVPAVTATATAVAPMPAPTGVVGTHS